MFNTFRIAFRLRNTYKANSIIWSLKGIPIIKKLLPSTLYANEGLKVFANLLRGLIEFFSVFIGKAIYLFAVWVIANTMNTSISDSFTHIFIFTTIVGGFLNTRIFDPSMDKFYAICLMRMDATQYALTDYIYFLLKMLVGFLPFSLLFGLLSKASILTCLLFPIYVISVKMCFTAFRLYDCKKHHKAISENSFSLVIWISTAVLLGLSALGYIGYLLPEMTLWIVCIPLVPAAVFCARYIFVYDSYRALYKELFKPDGFIAVVNKKATAGSRQQMLLQKKLDADLTLTSKKNGYSYFNELFMKRHSRLLTKSAKRITFCAALVVVAAVIFLYINPAEKKSINKFTLNYLPYFLFVMYLINSGKTITQAMFMNCDHSMLTYRFYRQPKAILLLFRERLKYVILINLMPAGVIAVGLPLLLYLSGGTTEPINYAILFVSIIAMSIFFSVHSMVMYYLLQPYNVNLESKSATYGIVNWITYFISYLAIQFHLPTLSFGISISAFCIIYAIVALILAYRRAPKTFCLRN